MDIAGKRQNSCEANLHAQSSAAQRNAGGVLQVNHGAIGCDVHDSLPRGQRPNSAHEDKQPRQRDCDEHHRKNHGNQMVPSAGQQANEPALGEQCHTFAAL